MKPIERLDRKLAYEGKVIRVYTDTVKLPNGKVSEWDYIGHVGAAAVLPVMPDGKILMVRQYRNALDRFTLELPAGKLDDPEESMKVCAARELEEETGYHSDNLEPLLTLNTTVAFCNEKIGIFIARDLVSTKRHLDDEEDIEVEAYSLDALCEMIDRQEMTDSKTVAAILAYRNKYGK
ncbi:MAG: NUDIX hydrolase [Clostridiales bacterium]|nr:NUDIX hydrolase [Clostridiales bacterium]